MASSASRVARPLAQALSGTKLCVTGIWMNSTTFCQDFASSANDLSEKEIFSDQRSGNPARKWNTRVRSQSPLDVALTKKFGGDTTTKPPFRSLFKAILAGEIANMPVQRVRKNGQVLTIFSISTGGMWRFPPPAGVVEIEPPEGIDQRLQYHKVTIHDERLGRFAMRELKKGVKVYVEGELESRVFNDPESGLVKRDREIAVRSSGRVLTITEKGAIPIDLVTL